jgi:hypothetical protein
LKKRPPVPNGERISKQFYPDHAILVGPPSGFSASMA